MGRKLLKYLYFNYFILFWLTISSAMDNRRILMYADTSRIIQDLKRITQTENPRNCLHPEVLNEIAKYIYDEFSKCCDSVTFQCYSVNGIEYKNVIGSICTEKKERIIIGAHYDVYGEFEGADDNASGVAGLLELARLLSKEDLQYRIDFVAYTLEEPPFFRTKNMGSYIHAKSLFDGNIPVIGMICLEMIGYYSDAENSQSYPLPFLNLFYGNKGDYILIVQKWWNGDFGDYFIDKMKGINLIETKSFTGPTIIPGLDFSDHLNYWKFGYSAVMITNTAFYRNKNYHKASDIIETLDIKRMGLVVEQIYLSLKKFK